MTTEAEPIAVRIDRAAIMLDATPSQVGHWIRAGRLPARKIGRAWRVRVEDIEAVLAPPGERAQSEVAGQREEVRA